jgi:hypothetical protein
MLKLKLFNAGSPCPRKSDRGKWSSLLDEKDLPIEIVEIEKPADDIPVDENGYYDMGYALGYLLELYRRIIKVYNRKVCYEIDMTFIITPEHREPRRIEELSLKELTDGSEKILIVTWWPQDKEGRNIYK